MYLHVYFEPLREDTARDGFSCGDPDLDDFFINDAINYQKCHVAYTTVSRLESTGDVVGFLTLAADSIQLDGGEVDDEPLKTVPAVKLCRLGVGAGGRGLCSVCARR